MGRRRERRGGRERGKGEIGREKEKRGGRERGERGGRESGVAVGV